MKNVYENIEKLDLLFFDLGVVEQTIEVGTQTAANLKGQVATDKCIMFFLFLIVCGVIAIIIVKVLSHLFFHCVTPDGDSNYCHLTLLFPNWQIVHPNNKNIRDIPGLAPPAGRKLLSLEALGN
ncbi:hypothetical protein BHE74_00038666 [Ensete ventricosum]|nr:hypothetical protein BHE74_00038666 [Ensete ventricosum]